MKSLFFGVAIATLLAFPAGAANIAAVNAQLLFDVLANDYNIEQTDILGIKQIEKSVDGTATYQVTTTTGPVLLSVRSGTSVNRDTNPCYAQYGGFHKPVAGICVYDPDMYVSQQTWSAPKTVVSDATKDVCETTTKTRTHSGRNPLTGYDIDVDVDTVDGTCPAH